MCENAELWSFPDEESQRRTLTSWLKSHNVEYEEDMTIEELRQLYIGKEIGRI